ncbi:alpha/beta hydrolase, partial [Rhizobium hidalgonense]|uniref:alpha/beta fold hydrolase n=1 Tax=Rhizobium hidalgonense TaxID=1538159 RepID=UPI0028728D55
TIRLQTLIRCQSTGWRQRAAKIALTLYPQFQAFFRERKPPTLIVWGKNDKIFPEVGAHPYLRDLPDAEMHLLDTGHFALEDKLDEMAPLIRDFLDRKIARH